MISDKTVDILVQSRYASYRAAFTAVVTHSITDYQPHFNINATSRRIPQNISLAGPLFHQSQWIDLLLGAGLFFEIISMGQIHLDKAFANSSEHQTWLYSLWRVIIERANS